MKANSMMSSSSKIIWVTNIKLSTTKQKNLSSGMGVDMFSKAVTNRIDMVDGLRELAKELADAKRLGPLKSYHQPPG